MKAIPKSETDKYMLVALLGTTLSIYTGGKAAEKTPAAKRLRLILAQTALETTSFLVIHPWGWWQYICKFGCILR